MLGSPGCWATFGEVLGQNGWTDARHQLATDAYAVSHPGVASDSRAVNSVAVHLILLHLVLEDGANPRHRHVLLRRMARPRAFPWLDPPNFRGRKTAADALGDAGPDDHAALILGWADDLWQAWSAQHATIRRWLRDGLGD